MKWLQARIRKLKADQIHQVLGWVTERYGELYPDWDITTVSLERKGNKNEQLSRMGALLENMKDRE